MRKTRTRAGKTHARGDYHDPAARETQAREDYHDPTAGIGGAPPARSALTLRLVLAVWGFLLCGVAAAVFLTVVNAPVPAAVAAFLAAAAAVDIVVVVRRKRRGEPG